MKVFGVVPNCRADAAFCSAEKTNKIPRQTIKRRKLRWEGHPSWSNSPWSFSVGLLASRSPTMHEFLPNLHGIVVYTDWNETLARKTNTKFRKRRHQNLFSSLPFFMATAGEWFRSERKNETRKTNKKIQIRTALQSEDPRKVQLNLERRTDFKAAFRGKKKKKLETPHASVRR